ncbi:IS200/IS605 family transposase, partial [Staphylococcus aureus]
FWCKGFYVDTVGRNKKVIENYIRNQLQEDIVADQISMEEYLDPFTGEKKRKIEKERKKSNPLGLLK